MRRSRSSRRPAVTQKPPRWECGPQVQHSRWKRGPTLLGYGDRRRGPGAIRGHLTGPVAELGLTRRPVEVRLRLGRLVQVHRSVYAAGHIAMTSRAHDLARAGLRAAGAAQPPLSRRFVAAVALQRRADRGHGAAWAKVGVPRGPPPAPGRAWHSGEPRDLAGPPRRREPGGRAEGDSRSAAADAARAS